MKTVNVSTLKAALSRYLREAQRGERVLVVGREEPLAELGPPSRGPADWRQRLSSEGKLRLATRDPSTFAPTSLGRPFDVQEVLNEVREDRLE